MIRISQIDDKFSIYKDKSVVLLGIGAGTKQIIDLFKYHKIDIDYICDNNKEHFGKLLDGIPVISPEHLKHLASKSDIVVQIAVNNIGVNMEELLKSIGINYVVSFNESINILNLMPIYPIFNKNKHIEVILKDELSIRPKSSKIVDSYNYFIRNVNLNDLIYLCMPTKTGDHTIMNTLNSKQINHFFTSHRPESIDIKLLKSINKKVKIITSIRDPISINLSMLYQMITNDGIACRLIFSQLRENFFCDGGDAQILFDHCYKNIDEVNPIEHFMNRFKENILDLSQYPFDKEKGYTIIKEGNIEVFVYQLERMNDITKEMSDWIGQTPFDKWVMGNEASGKWIANSYKQAQKEITFSQEYFDRCYDDPWVQHFYSQEDIEKFKARWRPHIKD